jgi:membrane-associated protease RseP (regulator of RpoE activity)
VIPGVPYITFILPSLGFINTPREPSVNRDRFFDLMLAGPLAGFVAALALGILGQLTLVPSTLSASGAQTVLSVISVQPLNPSVIQLILGNGLAGFAPSVAPGYLSISPLADSAGVGLLLAFTSLMPLAFFDGGLLCTAAFGSRFSKAATYVGVLALILVDAPSYWALAIVVLLMVGRPLGISTLDEVSEVSRTKKLAFIAAVVIALAALPIPAFLATIR